MGHCTEKMCYMSERPHSCCDLRQMGWRWNDLYRVYIFKSLKSLVKMFVSHAQFWVDIPFVWPRMTQVIMIFYKLNESDWKGTDGGKNER